MNQQPIELSANLNPRKALGGRILKVNHAGEHGAVNIYAGQLIFARFTARGMLPALAECQQHEQGHRALLQVELARRGIRRCRSYHFCGVGCLSVSVSSTQGMIGCGLILISPRENAQPKGVE